MNKTIFYLFLLVSQTFFSQNTVGTILIKEEVYDGYTLFTSGNNTFLINNCGQVINKWESNFPPGNAVYLLPNGNLLRAGKEEGKSEVFFGGAGGIVEVFDWEGNIIWSHSFNSVNQRQHHDVYPMPNGNILVLIAEVWNKADAIENGRNPSTISKEWIYNEIILEVKPIGTNEIETVWKWNLKDHIIQDYDNTKLNFGDVSKNPGKLDLNFLNGGNGNPTWIHINSMQYHEKLDQIILSGRNLSEIYIIDHSTTTEEAATNTGGNYNNGGDFIFRWGNPQAYKQGTEADRKLFAQHYPYFIEEGLYKEGNIILYNNGDERSPSFSEVFIIDPPEVNGFYEYTENTSFAPKYPLYEYSQFMEGQSESNFYSRILSSAQMLPNGNILICEGAKGNFFEINSNKEIVWNYKIPIKNEDGNIANQGENINSIFSFRAIKYKKDYAGFIGKDLSPKDPIETNFNIDFCKSTLNADSFNINNSVTISPNPSSSIFKLSKKIEKILVYNTIGKKILTLKNSDTIDLSNFKTGIYFSKLYTDNKILSKKLLKN